MLSRFSHVRLFATLWTVSCQASLSVGFSRPEYWSGCHALLQGIFPDPGIELESPVAPALQADSLPLSHRGSPPYALEAIYLSFVDSSRVTCPLLKQSLSQYMTPHTHNDYYAIHPRGVSHLLLQLR